MIKSRELPTASSEVKPNIRTAPGFQKLIKPSASVAMIASETVPRIASIRPCGTLAVPLDLEPAIAWSSAKSKIFR
jgi:hypothetical protein